MKKNKYIIKPNINDISLFEEVQGLDHNNNSILAKVVQEMPLTVFLNSQEIVTLMTINDYPEYLAVGYLLNQNMIYPNEKINKISYDKETNTIVIRTKRKTNYDNYKSFLLVVMFYCKKIHTLCFVFYLIPLNFLHNLLRHRHFFLKPEHEHCHL